MSDPDPSSRGSPDAPPGAFPATRWTLVGRAGASGAAQRLAIAELARLYAPALRAHLLQSLRYDEHRADDLLQGFLADKVLEQHLIAHADPARGRFRTFLLSALDRYVVDVHRVDSALKRRPPEGLQALGTAHDAMADPRTSRVASAFDLAWARTVIGEVLDTMQDHCNRTNRPQLWEVFVARYLKPATDNIAPESHDSLAARLNLRSAHDAANLLVTAKRLFTREFKTVVARYAGSESELREEVADLWRIFASAGR